ncbi:sulfurtransferase-like selenium metabolism protein YedF [Desulfosporosinus sp. PR]|uniref:sulfurtransferase-like selenium metabolism protein YedF n=1 Tax=Candidatus Desulfosporosinus nitrosoreducens TaxID=3401928 RepID=UPI0027F564D4|nr:sulfurtransferase-like selenium metabolism protein YedF [Desulfosporosinus sp. PR]MDQ7095295.1 sulfurtransferase-like selenium metabolism protein YedF [Desulfosporosinus sp. PR]
MLNIDCTGQVCPIPVIRAKKALEGMGEAGGVVAVLVDNDIARQNLQKMATGLGYQSEYVQKENGIIEVTIAAGEGCAVDSCSTGEDSGLVVAIGRNTMGEGSQELGQILIKGFIYALKELTPPPTHVLFFNSGSFLTSSDSNSLEDLRALEAAGTVILTCGTCTNYYEITEKLGVGEITNMYGIVTAMAEAKRLINI